MIRGVYQCTQMTLSYCKHSGSSKGTREFIDKLLPSFRTEHPHLNLDVVVRSGRHPFVRGHYVSGVSKTIGLRKLDAETVQEKCQFLHDQIGRTHTKLHDHRTEVVSLQARETLRGVSENGQKMY